MTAIGVAERIGVVLEDVDLPGEAFFAQALLGLDTGQPFVEHLDRKTGRGAHPLRESPRCACRRSLSAVHVQGQADDDKRDLAIYQPRANRV